MGTSSVASGAFVVVALAGLSGCGGHSYQGTVSPTLSPGLEPLADNLAHSALPDGQRAGPALAGIAYGPDQATDWTVPLQASACYAFGYAADADLTRLSLLIFEPSGRRVAIARARSGPGVLNYCAPVSGPFRVEAKALTGGGHYLVVVYSKGGAPGGAPFVAVAANAPVAGAPAAVQQPVGLDIPTAIDKQASVAAVGAARLGDFFSGSGDQSDWAAQLTSGTCYWFIGAGDAAKVHGLTLSLWDPKGAPLAQARSDSQVATLAYCAHEAGAYRFEAKVNGGNPAKGDYKVAVYSK
jgi:hypothetical protein